MKFISKNPSKDGKTILELAVNPAQAEQLVRLFEEGKLGELGVLNVEILSASKADSSQKQWAAPELEKRGKSRIDTQHEIP